jgi:hypothetical protein
MIQKLLADGAGYMLVLAGLVVTVTVGVMSILLPFLVFKIMLRVSAMNRKMARIIELLEEAGKRETMATPRQTSAPGVRLGPTAFSEDAAVPVGDKPLRFK